MYKEQYGYYKIWIEISWNCYNSARVLVISSPRQYFCMDINWQFHLQGHLLERVRFPVISKIFPKKKFKNKIKFWHYICKPTKSKSFI